MEHILVIIGSVMGLLIGSLISHFRGVKNKHLLFTELEVLKSEHQHLTTDIYAVKSFNEQLQQHSKGFEANSERLSSENEELTATISQLTKKLDDRLLELNHAKEAERNGQHELVSLQNNLTELQRLTSEDKPLAQGFEEQLVEPVIKPLEANNIELEDNTVNLQHVVKINKNIPDKANEYLVESDLNTTLTKTSDPIIPSEDDLKLCTNDDVEITIDEVDATSGVAAVDTIKQESNDEHIEKDFTLLESINFPEEYRVVSRLILSQSEEGLTVNQFIGMNKETLGKFSYMGAKKLETTQQLQRWLQDSTGYSVQDVTLPESNSPEWPDELLLSEILISPTQLDEEEFKLLIKISRTLKVNINELTLDKVVHKYQPKGTILSKPVKDIYCGLLNKIQQALPGHLVDRDAESVSIDEVQSKKPHSLQVDSTTFKSGMLLRYAELVDISAVQLDKQLSQDLKLFIESLDERDKQILTQRFAIGGEPCKTLEQIAQGISGGVTRERIRQLETKILDKLTNTLTYIPETIWSNVRQNLTSNIVDTYAKLFDHFSDERNFFRFLEVITEARKGEIKGMIKPQCSPDIVKVLFYNQPSPINCETVIEHISEETGFSQQQAANALFELQRAGNVGMTENGVFPVKLSSTQAIAQAALHFAEGAPFRVLHEFINQNGFCEHALSLERQDYGISNAVEEGYIYQSGHGQYRHRNFLDLSDEMITQVLTSVKSCLQQAKESGRDTLHLVVDIFDKALQEYDYFEFRHIVREYGNTQDIFFKGKSGADTVSLDQEFSLKGQKQAIIELFEVEPKSRTVQEISQVIRSKSVNHASFYINELVADNSLVRVDTSHWDLPHNAFNNAPVTQILERTNLILKKHQRPVEIGCIVDECNSRLHLQFSKAWYISCLRYHAKLKSIGWFFHSNLVALEDLNGLSIHQIVREVMDNNYSTDQLHSKIKEKIQANRTVISAAISAVKSRQESN